MTARGVRRCRIGLCGAVGIRFGAAEAAPSVAGISTYALLLLGLERARFGKAFDRRGFCAVLGDALGC